MRRWNTGHYAIQREGGAKSSPNPESSNVAHIAPREDKPHEVLIRKLWELAHCYD